jgi:hypothetical protein
LKSPPQHRKVLRNPAKRVPQPAEAQVAPRCTLVSCMLRNPYHIQHRGRHNLMLMIMIQLTLQFEPPRISGAFA